jgi:Na+/phosphate symporter
MEERTDFSSQQMSSTDLLKKKIFDYVFHLCNLATTKETEVADYTYETGFVRGVKLAKSLMWKYMKPEIKKSIKSIYEKLETDINNISETLDETQKKLEKQMLSDDASMQVLEILLVVLLYSSMSVEMKEIEVLGDFQELIKRTRSETPVKIFDSVISEKEE